VFSASGQLSCFSERTIVSLQSSRANLSITILTKVRGYSVLNYVCKSWESKRAVNRWPRNVSVPPARVPDLSSTSNPMPC
jgi:hypothetical protein